MLCIASLFRLFTAIIILLQMSVSKKRMAVYNRHVARPRVMAGFPDVNNKYPYVVTLESNASMQSAPSGFTLPLLIRTCTGIIISSNFVLTAAHCLMPGLLFVRWGNMSIAASESTFVSKILKQIPSPSYLNSGKSDLSPNYNDIALLQIEKVAITIYGRLNSADYKSLIGRSVKYAGFGATTYSIVEENSISELLELMKTPLQIGKGAIYKDDDYKVNTYPQLIIAPECSKKNQHAFYGDSGGPLFVGNKIVGVACGLIMNNWPVRNGRIQSHTAYVTYTPISPYLDWIRQIVGSREYK